MSKHFHELVLQARPDLSVQDITALLVSLTNLSLSCYPDKLEYVDQILGFAHGKIKEYGDKLSRHDKHYVICSSWVLCAVPMSTRLKR